MDFNVNEIIFLYIFFFLTLNLYNLHQGSSELTVLFACSFEAFSIAPLDWIQNKRWLNCVSVAPSPKVQIFIELSFSSSFR